MLETNWQQHYQEYYGIKFMVVWDVYVYRNMEVGFQNNYSDFHTLMRDCL